MISLLQLAAVACAILQTAVIVAEPSCLADVVLAIDNSGSIGNSEPEGGATWQAVLDFARKVVQSLNVQDTMTHVGLVDFDDETRVSFVLDSHTSELDVLADVAALKHRGGFTNITGGVFWGRELLTQAVHGARAGTPKVLILLTDGNQNRAEGELQAEVDRSKAAGIRIVTVGVTGAANINQLRAIASTTADYVHISDSTAVAKIRDSTIKQCATKPAIPPQTTPSSVSGTAGASYIRWGRDVCPTGAKLVYKGVVAGSHYAHVGSGHEYLCLPENPQFGKTVPGDQGWTGYLYGTEYEFYLTYDKNQSPLSFENFGGTAIWQNDVPCAVCVNPNAYTSLMIPAVQNCSQFNWNLEYSGYLASTDKTYNGRQYLCLDGAPNVVQGGIADRNGALFYPVQARCGALPCPAYVESWELTCAVCSK